MGFFNKLFGGKDEARTDPLGGKPPMYGGDGSSPEQAVVVNCASMGTANHLIDRFISERHGEKGKDWQRGIEMFVNAPDVAEYTIRSIGVELSNGGRESYFFDVSRPMSGSKNVAKMMGAWPKDIE